MLRKAKICLNMLIIVDVDIELEYMSVQGANDKRPKKIKSALMRIKRRERW